MSIEQATGLILVFIGLNSFSNENWNSRDTSAAVTLVIGVVVFFLGTAGR